MNIFVFVYKFLCLVSVILDLCGQKKIGRLCCLNNSNRKNKKLFFIIRFSSI